MNKNPETFAEQFKVVADIRNQQRPFKEKMNPFAKKAQAKDIACEEAFRINNLVDSVSDKRTPGQRSEDLITKSGEFALKKMDILETTERFRAQTPEMIEYIQAGEIDKAYKIYLREHYDFDKVLQPFPNDPTSRAFKDLINDQLETAIVVGEPTAIKKLIIQNDHSFNLEMLKRVPLEILKTGEVQARLIKEITDKLYYPLLAKGIADKLVEFGAMTRKNADAILKQEA